VKLLSDDELRARARALRLVVTDVDGVLTDTGVYYSERGEELKRFSVRDGMGMELLQSAGIETAILTRETSGPVKARAAKLRLSRVYLGVRDKAAFLPELLEDTSLTPRELAFIGDDVNDVELLRAIGEAGLTACPGNAMPAAREVVHYQCTAHGGHGAFRELADFILRLRA
jgi:3-deoxy-D-manno-octulosonate 8-phosphate phosphatase (KDO 8-P phosphatase)